LIIMELKKTITIWLLLILYSPVVISQVMSDVQLKPLNDWLHEAELDTYFQMTDFYDLHHFDSSFSITSKQGIEEISLKIAGFRSLNRYAVNDPDYIPRLDSLLYSTSLTRLNWIDRSLKPRYIFRLNCLQDETKLKQLERDFINLYGMTLWTRVFNKISLLYGLKTEDLGFYLPFHNSDSLVFEMKGIADRVDKSRSGSYPMDISSVIGVLSKPVVEKFNFNNNNINEDFLQFLNSYFSKKNASIATIQNEKFIVEVRVRGLRGEIIKGNEDWEIIQIFFIPSFTSVESHLTFIVDGSLSSGIGKYPPDTQFTNSMDPKYKGNLEEYAKVMATSFKAFLNHKYKQK
jgi:hypothetical protein